MKRRFKLFISLMVLVLFLGCVWAATLGKESSQSAQLSESFEHKEEGLVFERSTPEYTAFRVETEPGAVIEKLVPAYLPENLSQELENLYGEPEPRVYRAQYTGKTAEGADLYFSLSISFGFNATIAVDTEDAVTETVDLLDRKAIAIQKNGISHIHWVRHGLQVSVGSNLPYDEVFLIVLSLYDKG